ncbi:hypothetical protein FGG08_002841 [Glutinoglossum americanum]|uniref:Uncharacterized protein n=1 Tax=Glutinoglossum americanum TaxID=1670608 RepID=A0A9P8IEE9_9PEZI|nr:hypothetical protein FGG08_002841 [Glutinoglossum americanum]
MAPSNPYFYFSSPTVVLPPQQPPHTFANDVAASPSSFNFGSPFAQSSSSSRATKFALQLTTPLINKSSRKRTRDEITSPVEHEDDFGPLKNPISSSPIVIPTHAEHVVAQKSSFTTDASHEPTTSWDHDTVSSKPSTPSSLTGSSPPKLTSRKSQRLDSTSSQLETDFASITESSPPKSIPAEPAIDNFTLLLGVGWTRLSEDEHIQAAARGWTRYIANHFPISGPAILLQSKGLSSFLVGANEGFFLFHEDLNQGQLVGTTWESTLKNLRVTPVTFENLEVLRPAASPIAGGAVFNGAEPQAAMKDEVMSATADEPAGQEFSMDLD